MSTGVVHAEKYGLTHINGMDDNMGLKFRGNTLVEGDTVQLGFCSFNSGLKDPAGGVTKVDIYHLGALEPTLDNPLGKSLVITITGDSIIHDSMGRYHIELPLNFPQFQIGSFQDVWSYILDPYGDTCQSVFEFIISNNLWFTDTQPLVHDFNFKFRPNRVTKGSRKYIEVIVEPNLPHTSEKRRFYENVISCGELSISIKKICSDCLPQEEDLKLVVDNEIITERAGNRGWYFLDTTNDDLDCGIYDVVFVFNLGESTFISEAEPLQVYR